MAVPRRAVPDPAPGIVPILYYHRASPLPPDFRSMSQPDRAKFLAIDVLPVALEAQLDWLQAAGYHTILPRDLVAHWTQGTPLPSRPIILTFDDGYPSWMCTIFPLLSAHGMVAEFYTTVDRVGPDAITWDDLRTLAAAGNGIGAHDVHHVQLTDRGPGRPPASPATMRHEVGDARRIIGAEIGTPPDSMAYVGGGFDARLEAIAQAAGYTTARSIRRGVVQDPAHRYTLRVSRIGAYDDVVKILTGELVPGLPTFEARVLGTDPG